MAGLYRPSYLDKKTKKKRKTPKWYAWYVNCEGRKVRIPLSEDKAIAQQMLGELLKHDKQARHGLRDPFTDQRARPLAEHLADWERFLVSKAVKRRSEQNARQVVGRVRRVLDACGFEKLDSNSRPVDFLGTGCRF